MGKQASKAVSITTTWHLRAWSKTRGIATDEQTTNCMFCRALHGPSLLVSNILQFPEIYSFYKKFIETKVVDFWKIWHNKFLKNPLTGPEGLKI